MKARTSLLILALAIAPWARSAEGIDPGAPNLPVQKIGPEDLLAIQVYEAPEFTRTVRVNTDGYIRLPMVPDPIRVDGLYPPDIEVLIADSLKRNKLFVDPFVTVTVVDYHSRPVSVIGAVRNPVIFQVIGTVRLLDAITRAGGLTDTAGPDIIVTRPSAESAATPPVLKINSRSLIAGMDPGENIRLNGGEEIRVPEVGKVVVAGNVRRSGVYPVQDSGATTVLTAIAQAEGLAQYHANIAYIYRTDKTGKRQEIAVPLGNIMKRKTADMTLEPRDLLYVPDSTGKKATAETIERLIGFGAQAGSWAIIYH